MQDIFSEDELIIKLDELKTREASKASFWQELKDKKYRHNQSLVNGTNLLIDMPNEEQRKNFISKYKHLNPIYDYFRTDIPEEYKSLYSNNNFKYPDCGIPIVTVSIEDLNDVGKIFKEILESLNVTIELDNFDEIENRCFDVLKTLSVEMVLINYMGKKITSSNQIESVLYHLCKTSEITKISFNTIGSISPRVFYRDERNIPIGNYVAVSGESNCSDVEFETHTIALGKDNKWHQTK